MQLYTRALTPDYASPELCVGTRWIRGPTSIRSVPCCSNAIGRSAVPAQLRGRACTVAAALEQHLIKFPSEVVVAGAGPARATTDERLTGRLRGELDRSR